MSVDATPAIVPKWEASSALLGRIWWYLANNQPGRAPACSPAVHTEAGFNIGKACYGYRAKLIAHPVPAKRATGQKKTLLVSAHQVVIEHAAMS
ncbi:hypothetical protein OHB12_28660 [Nocardia sp. NBC_01730]|uniref:hypothetical protein n=1 Tax=Nocardia sp. NBC_01730 TaxID=2975998 RepID=UPI002E12E671|nr:hypothetical protein OHB12_28660 [Nocardia sp. NBC_01730]